MVVNYKIYIFAYAKRGFLHKSFYCNELIGQSMVRKTLLLCIFICTVVMLGAQESTVRPYHLPDIPDSLTTPDVRSEYLIEHYWDQFEVENRAYLNAQEIVEQAFVDFASIMRIASRESTMKAIDTLLDRAVDDEDILLMYADIADKYLYSGEGNFVSEEAYLPFVKAVLDSKKVDKLRKLRYSYQYDVLTKNQLGMVLTDFEYKLPGKEKTYRIKKLKSPFTLLYINDPECEDCSLTTLRLSVSQALLQEIKAGRLTILSVYPDGETEEWLTRVAEYPKEWIVASMENGDRCFDLRIMPVLYLLDKDKKIILRNTSLEEVEAVLKDKK